MGRRKAAGAAIFALSVAGFVAYAYLLMLSEWSPVVLQLSVLMIVGGILGAVSWIGYTMATTRPSSASVYPDAGPAFWPSARPPPAPASPPPASPSGPRPDVLDAAGRPSVCGAAPGGGERDDYNGGGYDDDDDGGDGDGAGGIGGRRAYSGAHN